MGGAAISGTFLLPGTDFALASGGYCDDSPPQCDLDVGCRQVTSAAMHSAEPAPPATLRSIPPAAAAGAAPMRPPLARHDAAPSARRWPHPGRVMAPAYFTSVGVISFNFTGAAPRPSAGMHALLSCRQQPGGLQPISWRVSARACACLSVVKDDHAPARAGP